MRAQEIIMKKRDGAVLSKQEIQFLIDGYVAGSIPEYQVSAWLMAVFFKGMTPDEAGVLTDCMIRSGKVFDLSDLKGPFVDKHSTGGVGDKLSLLIAPLAAACGVTVPMMSGRALGHTGGTLDKLDTIPGFSTALSFEEFKSILKGCGFAMTGQSKEVVPADRLLYALRDVTATVESIPLITASILSKKFAEGARSFVFDVKCGHGAFMKNIEDARALAESLSRTAKSLDRSAVSVITNMDVPIGTYAGNFLEVKESYYALKGEGPEDTVELSLRLAGWMLVAGGICSDIEDAVGRCREVLANGKALELFMKNIELQGGDTRAFLHGLDTFKAAILHPVKASADGYVQDIDAFKIGMSGIGLGVGRNKTEDQVEANVGFEFIKKPGAEVKTGDVLCYVHAETDSALKESLPLIESAFIIGDKKPQLKPMILEEITAL